MSGSSAEVARGGGARPEDALLSVVVPLLDEEACVDELSKRVRQAAERAGVRLELILVDDGSEDATAEHIDRLCETDPAVKGLHFTRNFGHQAALLAGMHAASGDAVVTMDGDLQHPPELLPDLVRAWRGGADVVHTRRRVAAVDTGPKEWAGRFFYRGMAALSDVPMERASADFRLLDRRVVDAFNQLEERFVFTRGLIPWLGFPQTSVEYDVAGRFAGESKYGVVRMLRLALDGIFSFSVRPLRAIVLLGLATTLFGIGFGIFAVIDFATGGATAAGWTSIVTLLLIFGGVQLLSIGVLSEYVGRIYEEVKRRPRYVIRSTRGFGPLSAGADAADPARGAPRRPS